MSLTEFNIQSAILDVHDSANEHSPGPFSQQPTRVLELGHTTPT